MEAANAGEGVADVFVFDLGEHVGFFVGELSQTRGGFGGVALGDGEGFSAFDELDLGQGRRKGLVEGAAKLSFVAAQFVDPRQGGDGQNEDAILELDGEGSICQIFANQGFPNRAQKGNGEGETLVGAPLQHFARHGAKGVGGDLLHICFYNDKTVCSGTLWKIRQARGKENLEENLIFSLDEEGARH